jgi:hypothetical protein
MHDKWQKGFKGAAILLCVLALWPIAQMLFRKSPLQDIHPIQLKASEPTPAKEPDKDKSGGSLPGRSNNQMDDLPPDIEKRSAKLEESGILGRTPKPPPMALIGIAEPYAFLQTPTGQTEKIKEGESLNGVKVLRVGSNRVLVEHEGQTSELSIFSGIGSESLMPSNNQ